MMYFGLLFPTIFIFWNTWFTIGFPENKTSKKLIIILYIMLIIFEILLAYLISRSKL